MDIKKSFKRFKKNYIRESEAFDNEDFVDVDLEGTNKTGVDWAEQYYDCGGDNNSWLDIATDYCLKAGLDADSFDTQEQVEEFLAGVSYDEMVSVLGTPEEAANSEQQTGLSDDYIDPETTLDTDDGYDTDFNESCCGGGKKKDKKKGKKDKKSKFVPFWAKKKDKELKEALKTLKDAGYSIINECGVDCELEDDATGFGIAFDDSDYYTEDGECEVCAICGKESCDGEYDEDGNFVCSDCAENSLEQPMEEIDPMDIYFRAAKADNIRDMNRFVR